MRVATEAARSDQDHLRKLMCEGILLTKVPAGCNDGEAAQLQRDEREER